MQPQRNLKRKQRIFQLINNFCIYKGGLFRKANSSEGLNERCDLKKIRHFPLKQPYYSQEPFIIKLALRQREYVMVQGTQTF